MDRIVVRESLKESPEIGLGRLLSGLAELLCAYVCELEVMVVLLCDFELTRSFVENAQIDQLRFRPFFPPPPRFYLL